jgi:hypothetical protein
MPQDELKVDAEAVMASLDEANRVLVQFWRVATRDILRKTLAAPSVRARPELLAGLRTMLTDTCLALTEVSECLSEFDRDLDEAERGS